jgi:hypothetical protein
MPYPTPVADLWSCMEPDSWVCSIIAHTFSYTDTIEAFGRKLNMEFVTLFHRCAGLFPWFQVAHWKQLLTPLAHRSVETCPRGTNLVISHGSRLAFASVSPEPKRVWSSAPSTVFVTGFLHRLFPNGTAVEDFQWLFPHEALWRAEARDEGE